MVFPPPVDSFQIDFKGFDIIRGRDCVIFGKAEIYTVGIDDVMLAGGWDGGTGVTWVDSLSEIPMVSYSNGLYGGFLIFGSSETADQYVSSTQNQLAYGRGVIATGNAVISTSTYERYTYASRVSGGFLVSLVYTPGEPLYFSKRGLWTNEKEGTPLGDNFFTGFVMQAPSKTNQFFLGIQTSL
jgi:hypothetical protein